LTIFDAEINGWGYERIDLSTFYAVLTQKFIKLGALPLQKLGALPLQLDIPQLSYT
jgi:hypothetical protein